MKKIITFLKKWDPVNTAFLLITPLIGIGGTLALALYGHISWATVVLAVIMAIFTGLAITAGYHRLFSHKSYEASPFYKFFMLMFGAAAFENSAFRWCSDHRNHHKYVDTDQDPYNIKRGFWYAHMGWVMLRAQRRPDFSNIPDLTADPLVQFQHHHYVKLGILFGFVLPTALAALWGDALGGFLIAGFLRTVLNHHFTFSINSFAHMIGNRPYSEKDTSRDNWLLAFFTYGEGYHNFHHRFPSDYRNAIRYHQWDPTKWLVKACEWVGQTSQLRRTPNEIILRARLKMDQKRLLRKMEAQAHRKQLTEEFIENARLKIEEAYSRFRSLKEERRRLKREHAQAGVAMSGFHEKLKALNSEVEQIRRSLRQSADEWMEMCRNHGVSSSGLIYV